MGLGRMQALLGHMRLVEIWAGVKQKRVNLHAGLGVMPIDLTSVLAR